MHLVTLTLGTFFLISNIESVIRNDLTDRCLHVGLLNQNDKESVYATTCSWNSADGTYKSHPDEWLEIVEGGLRGAPENRRTGIFFIRKVTNTSDMCLATVDNQPEVESNCPSPEASFAIDFVDQNNFKGVITSYMSFKIRNAAGKCLTIRPGQPFLQFKDCSPRQGLFQVWSVCRHNKMCDVPFTWTPRHIIFPLNGTNMTDYDKSIGSTYQKQIETPIGMDNGVKIQASKTAYINEVLYTVQNAASLYENTEQFLIDGIRSFYTKESLAEARLLLLKICIDENLRCNLCTQCGSGESSLNTTVVWLMRWISECNTHPTSMVFLSSDVLQVPHHLFPSHESSHLQDMSLLDKYKLIIPTIRKYLSELEAKLNENDATRENPLVQPIPAGETKSSSEKSVHVNENTPHGNADGPKLNVGNVHAHTTDNYDKVPAVTMPTEKEEINTTQDYASIIDIRLLNG